MPVFIYLLQLELYGCQVASLSLLRKATRGILTSIKELWGELDSVK